MSKSNCDKPKASRKGRRPKNGVAMSPAERKRQQRRRERQKKTELPSWLRMRREIWQIVQGKFILNSAAEVSAALNAVAMAISIEMTNSLYDKNSHKLDGVGMLVDPVGCCAEVDAETLSLIAELKPFACEDETRVYPRWQKLKLFDVISDIITRHELEASQ